MLVAICLPSALVAAGMFWARDVRVAFLLYLVVGCGLAPWLLLGARPFATGPGLRWTAAARVNLRRRHLIAWALFGPAFFGAYSLVRRYIGDPERYLDQLQALGWRHEQEVVFALLFLLLIPLAEEWWWRGQALPRCVHAFGRLPGIALAAVAFSAYHIFTLAPLYDPQSTLVRWMAILAAGLVWSLMALKWSEWSMSYFAHLGADMAIVAAFFLYVT